MLGSAFCFLLSLIFEPSNGWKWQWNVLLQAKQPQKPKPNPNKHHQQPPQKATSTLLFSSFDSSKKETILKLLLEFSQAVKIHLFLLCRNKTSLPQQSRRPVPTPWGHPDGRWTFQLESNWSFASIVHPIRTGSTVQNHLLKSQFLIVSIWCGA